MASATIPSSEAPEIIGPIGRIFGALFSPALTFKSIARKPTWFLPLLLVCLISLGLIGLFGHRVGWRSFFEKQDANSSRVQQMPPDQQQRVLDAQVRFGVPYVYAIGALSPILVAIVIASLFLGVFNGLVGARLNFKVSLGIVAHSWIPSLIPSLLGMLVILLKDPSTVDLQNMIASNPAAFLSDDLAKWLVALLRSLDVFTFWTMILMAIGYSAAAPKSLSTGKAFFWILGFWFLSVLVRVALTAAFS